VASGLLRIVFLSAALRAVGCQTRTDSEPRDARATYSPLGSLAHGEKRPFVGLYPQSRASPGLEGVLQGLPVGLPGGVKTTLRS
jgi:hypothetical protein